MDQKTVEFEVLAVARKRLLVVRFQVIFGGSDLGFEC